MKYDIALCYEIGQMEPSLFYKSLRSFQLSSCTKLAKYLSQQIFLWAHILVQTKRTLCARNPQSSQDN